MMPEAPVRFSTMNCCLSESVSFAARMRASGSTEPPGGYGETNLTTFVGHSGAEHRPQVGIAEQPICGALHVQHVLRMRADAAADAEHRLDEKRRLQQLAVEEMRRGVQVADVVALDLEARVVVAAALEDIGDI